MIVHAVLSVVVAVAVAAPPAGGGVLAARARGLSAPQGEAGWGRAPDGERGFGPGRTLREITRLLRSPAEEDRALVASLRQLETDLRILLGLVSDRYRDLGYFALLEIVAEEVKRETAPAPGEAPPLERLGEVFRERASRAAAVFEGDGPEADLLARMLVDARFRARAGVIEGLEFEMADLRAGLAVLHADLDGFASLRDHEAEAIARRVDLAAARMRAAKLDLEALREGKLDETANAVWARDLERLLMLARSADAAQREKELPGILDRLDQREQAMSASLFTARQAAELEMPLTARAAAVANAAEMLPKVRAYLPGTAEGNQAGGEIGSLPKSRRHAYAAHLAAEALSYDPLGEELNYLAAEATDFLYGTIESRRWFDRFLALRGIRVHDHRTFQGRALTREEKRALDAVQATGTTPK